MRKKLYGHFSEQVLGKFSRIRYAAYESQEALDTIKRAGDAPQEHILEFFTTFLEAASELIRIFCYGAVFAGLSFWCLILGIPAFGAMLYFDLIPFNRAFTEKNSTTAIHSTVAISP